MKRTDPISIRQLIDKVMLEGETRETVMQQRASYMWTEVVGPGVNRFTFRRYVERGVLHVYITSASLKNDLAFLRHNIIKEINGRLGAEVLSDIVIH
ncbi:DUF721 domain-containing protein [Muribaculaceae bacterium Isolate-002 (NCI)]|nr:DUF721 domain-containing protein [Muribaculaceae bacterium Isolate-002 (NCI)]